MGTPARREKTARRARSFWSERRYRVDGACGVESLPQGLRCRLGRPGLLGMLPVRRFALSGLGFFRRIPALAPGAELS